MLLAPPRRGIAVGVCGGMILALLAGMTPGNVRAASFGRHAHRPSDSWAGGFHFDDLRVQASAKNGGPALSRVRTGQKFWIFVYIKHGRPTTRLVCSYALSNEAGRVMVKDSKTASLAFSSGTFYNGFDALTASLARDVREERYLIHASVSLNGVTQTRTTRLMVYR